MAGLSVGYAVGLPIAAAAVDIEYPDPTTGSQWPVMVCV